MPHEPPFRNNEVEPTPLPTEISVQPWPQWPKILLSKREKLTQHIRYIMFRKKSFDDVLHPGPNQMPSCRLRIAIRNMVWLG